MSDQNLARYWDQRSKTWSGIPEPLKPTDSDVAILNTMASRYALPKPSTLILGATPKLYNIFASDEIICVDISMDMMLQNYTKDVKFVQGNWLDLSFIPDSSIEAILGDGVLTLLKREEYETLFKELHRISRCGAIFMVRVFTNSPHLEYANKTEHLNRFLRYLNSPEKDISVDTELGITYSFPLLSEIIKSASKFFKLQAIELAKGDIHFPILCLKRL